MAYKFLRKCGKDSDKEDSGISSKVLHGLNRENDDNKSKLKQQGHMDLGLCSGVCFAFQISGKCTRRDCRYKYIYSKALYLNYSFKNLPPPQARNTSDISCATTTTESDNQENFKYFAPAIVFSF